MLNPNLDKGNVNLMMRVFIVCIMNCIMHILCLFVFDVLLHETLYDQFLTLYQYSTESCMFANISCIGIFRYT